MAPAPAAGRITSYNVCYTKLLRYFGNQFFFQGYRRLQEGTNTEVEMGRFLTEATLFRHIVPLAGSIELHRGDDSVLTLGLS